MRRGPVPSPSTTGPDRSRRRLAAFAVLLTVIGAVTVMRLSGDGEPGRPTANAPRPPSLLAAEQAVKPSGATRRAAVGSAPASAALAVLARERRRGPLAAALGRARIRVLQIGALESGGRRIGATMLVALAVPRRQVRATVPAYLVAGRSSSAPYTSQRAAMRVAVLRDALIDIDLRSGRVVSFEPGPRSRTASWSPSSGPSSNPQDED